ncbi:MAG: hypothetical protein ABR926_22000 [Streptosporangiaceae bacterium]|jgi:hypothetical protein
MSLTDLLRPGRIGLAGRLPARLEDLHGPERGVIVLPRHLSWPGMREFDVTDDRLRRSMYGIVLTQGRRNDLARFVNPRLLTQDWPLLRSSLDPKLRRWCERRLALRGLSTQPAQAGPVQAGPVQAGPVQAGAAPPERAAGGADTGAGRTE